MRKILVLIFIFFMSCVVFGQELIVPENIKVNLQQNEEMSWNRYVAGEFTVLSINDSQGNWLAKNVSNIKTWSLNRWGFPNFSLKREFRIFCVPNSAYMKKLFGITDSQVEEREDVLVLWLVLNDKPQKVIPKYLTQLLFIEFQKEYKTKLGYWFIIGSSSLNTVASEIRQVLSNMPRENMFTIKEIFDLSNASFNNLDEDRKNIYIKQSMYLCLMLRKEFGEAKFQGFLRCCVLQDAESSLQAVYGYKNYDEFQTKYLQYVKDLNLDLQKNKTPDSYLEIQNVFYK